MYLIFLVLKRFFEYTKIEIMKAVCWKEALKKYLSKDFVI